MIVMINVVMCDDEREVIKHYKTVLENTGNMGDNLTINFFSSPIELLKKNELIAVLDIIYLDNFMDHMNGIEVAREIRKYNSTVKIIFLSSSEAFVFDAFDVNARNYLMKDLSDEQFVEVFLSVVKEVEDSKNNEQILVSYNGQTKVVNVDDIISIEIIMRRTCVYTKLGLLICYESIGKFEETLKNKEFYLINRSTLVNMKEVTSVKKNIITLSDERLLEISFRKVDHFRKAFCKLYNNS
ncbi:MAG: LytTR family DNA-binding domain-containing protein [Erysipelotrichaceae bacterium]